MTDNKMKLGEAEIIKALDLCANTKGCRECPLHSMHSANCIKNLQNNALALINRQKAELADLNNLLKLSNDIQNEYIEKIDEQKAEIEKLKQNLKEAHIDIKEHMAKNERLHEAINGFEEQSHKEFLDYMKLSEKYQNAKSEAVKEFAKRLKDIYESDKRYDRPNAHTLVDKLFANIDNLVKEMTEWKGR